MESVEVINALVLRAVALLINTNFIYVAILGYAVLLALLLSFIYAWQYTARKGGKSL